MQQLKNYKIYIDKNWGLFFGELNDNVLHQHYALQISISSDTAFLITDDKNRQQQFSACFINSNVPHQLINREATFVLLINPISSLGHQLYLRYENQTIANTENDLGDLKKIVAAFFTKELSFEELIQKTSQYLFDFQCKCAADNHFSDDRILNSIYYLEQNYDRIVSLEEIAATCFLSRTRFLHLFKEKTNINYRRYQRWNKLVKSLPYLSTHSITETAHLLGFTDSAHYSRTFKETFGLSPKFLTTLK